MSGGPARSELLMSAPSRVKNFYCFRFIMCLSCLLFL